MRALPALVLLLAVAAHAQPTSFQGLGTLPGDIASTAAGVSDDGTVVVGFSDDGGGAEAFRWTAGGMQGLGFLPGGIFSTGAGVSADGGTVVGQSGSQNGVGFEAFRWRDGGMQALGFVPGSFASDAKAASADGAVVVGNSTLAIDGMDHAFRWTADGGMQDLGVLFPDGFFSTGADVSADGAVVVGGSGRAFRWTQPTGMVSLGSLPGGPFSSASAVSADGSVVVGVGVGGNGLNEAFRWTAATGMIGLGTLPAATASQAFGVSAGGGTVVGRSSGRAFVWTAAEGMRDVQTVLAGLGLDLTGWALTTATDVSADGRVLVGSGTNPGGQTEAWRAVLSGGHRWVNASGGSWDVAANWEPASVPGPSDQVRFDIPGTYTVFGSTPKGPRTVLGLHAQDGTVDYELDNLNLISVSLTAPSLAVSADAIAKVISGSTTIVDAVVGFADNAAGDTTTTARLQVFNAGTSLSQHASRSCVLQHEAFSTPA